MISASASATPHPCRYSHCRPSKCTASNAFLIPSALVLSPPRGPHSPAAPCERRPSATLTSYPSCEVMSLGMMGPVSIHHRIRTMGLHRH
ncbi:hypothetical protein C8Q77DRAFT_546904 [Trametes polyzona]|nr:hypothetical protein C8Q77DRAFT_546904 [Trametes polyzona]